jgi:hypothetical protein
MERQKAEIQGLLHPAQENLDILLRGFSLPTCPQHSLKSALAPKSHVSFKERTALRTELFIFHISIRIICNRISEGLL